MGVKSKTSPRRQELEAQGNSAQEEAVGTKVAEMEERFFKRGVGRLGDVLQNSARIRDTQRRVVQEIEKDAKP